MTELATSGRGHVVIAGGGVAALEALIALRELAPVHVRITLLAPEREFVNRPMAVAEPFRLGHDTYYLLSEIARALPVLLGPAIDGVPADEAGFVPVDEHGRVRGLDGVFAAGDVTSWPIKQGGLAAQQAVAAAEAIAARHGADPDPQPYRPVLRGLLLTGGRRRWLRAPVGATPGSSRAELRALWWPPTKIASRYLAPYLLRREETAMLTTPMSSGHPVARDLELLGARPPEETKR